VNLNGKTALVTGGASGLGLATVRSLIDAGARVVIVDLGHTDGETVAKELGDGTRFAAADVTSSDEVQAASPRQTSRAFTSS
jgi:NAD(P)-dependent dehydrogenase (short-subunit alcohol dehydrogenase family)